MSTAPPPTSPPEQGTGALARGASIGRYVVLGLVGRGGMGEVYAAYDPELDRKVAVKLLRVKPGNGVSLVEGRQRTLREAQAIARLSHPNVVVVYDVGTFRDQVFIAMEFVEGNTATYWVQSQSRNWQEILKVFMAAGRGLTAAHEKGLVHRDFKPDNVMVGRDGQVRVMDFGLARQVNEKAGPTRLPSPPPPPDPPNDGLTGSGDGEPRITPTVRIPVVVSTNEVRPAPDPMTTLVLNIPPSAASEVAIASSDTQVAAGMFEVQLTRTGAMMGTPAYMAPEQFLGTPTDARTDQFSFCIALYEALYGERPFAGNTMFALTSNVVQGNVREAPAAADVPLWIRRILLRGLSPKAADRFPTMAEMLDALTKNPSTARRKWAMAALVAVMPIALGLGIQQSLADHRSVCGGASERLNGIWELRSNEEGPSARQTRVRNAFLKTGKSYAGDVFNTVDRVLTRYARSWASMHREACEAMQVRGEQSAEVLDLRMSCLQERLGGLRAITEVFSEASGEVVENAVNAANALGPLERCEDVALLRQVVRPPEDPATKHRVTESSQHLADLQALYRSGRWREAMRRAPTLVTESRAIGYQPLIAEVLALQGKLMLQSNDTKLAERTLIESFWAADASRHDEVRVEAASSLVYAVGYQQLRFEDGRRWAKTAEAVLQRLGGHELLQAWLLNDLGNVMGLEGEKEAELKAHEQALALKEKALGREHADVGLSEGNIASALQSLGRNQEALTHVDRAIVLLENRLGGGHPELATQMNNRGEILNALGRHRDARQSFERARIIWERELGLDDRNLAYALAGIGTSYLAEGNPTSALIPLERAFKIREAHETDPARRAETRFALARALWESNRDRVRARALAAEAKAGFEKLSAKARLVEVDGWLRDKS